MPLTAKGQEILERFRREYGAEGESKFYAARNAGTITGVDDGSRMRAYTVEKIGPKREKTPEGFLICYDVPLARTGEQIYGPDETPIKPASRLQYVTINRSPEEVFRPETIASAIGKPFIIYHPDDMSVTPDNARELARGHIMNPRQGTGPDADVLLGDLMVWDAAAIALIDAGLREVSMGYDCDYDELGEPGSGLGRQRNILINHCAGVDEGRCGPRCAIGDHSACSTSEKEGRMATTDRRSTFADRINALLDRAFKAKDEKEKEAIKQEAKDVAKDDAGEAGHHIEVHNHLPGEKAEDAEGEEMKKLEKKVDDGFKAINDAIAKLAADRRGKDSEETEEERKAREDKEKAADGELLSELEMEAPTGTGDKARKANDSAYLEDSYQKTIADAEILAPGIRVPTFDRAAKPKATFDSICGLRRSALDLAYGQPDTRGMIEQVTGRSTFDSRSMKCGDVRTIFNSVAAMKRAANNSANTAGANRIGDGRMATTSGPIKTLADLQRTYDEAYKKKA